MSASIPETLQDMRELFERAVEDYLCEWTMLTYPHLPISTPTPSSTSSSHLPSLTFSPILHPHLTLPFSLNLLCPSPSSYSALLPHLTLPFSLILLCPSPSSYSALLPHLTLPFSLILLCPSPSSYSALLPHLTLPFSLILLCPSPSSYSALLPHLTLPFSLILLCPSPSSYSALLPHLTLPFSLILLCPSPSSYSVAVRLWLLFAKFALEKFSAFSEGMEFPRDIFEKAIIACGLHVSSVSHVIALARSITM